MNDFVDLPQEGQEYDHARKMQNLRQVRKQLGLQQISPIIMGKQKQWWTGQMDIATAAALESAIARDDSITELLADITPKERPKLSEAHALIDRAPDELKPLAEEHRAAVSAQLRHRQDGLDAKEGRQFAYMTKCYAQEYVAYIRARGYKHLIRYYMGGGTRPRLLDDV